MSGVGPIAGGMSVERVMQMRAEILARNEALSRAGTAGPAAPATTQPTSFASTLAGSLRVTTTFIRPAWGTGRGGVKADGR